MGSAQLKESPWTYFSKYASKSCQYKRKIYTLIAQNMHTLTYYRPNNIELITSLLSNQLIPRAYEDDDTKNTNYKMLLCAIYKDIERNTNPIKQFNSIFSQRYAFKYTQLFNSGYEYKLSKHECMIEAIHSIKKYSERMKESIKKYYNLQILDDRDVRNELASAIQNKSLFSFAIYPMIINMYSHMHEIEIIALSNKIQLYSSLSIERFIASPIFGLNQKYRREITGKPVDPKYVPYSASRTVLLEILSLRSPEEKLEAFNDLNVSISNELARFWSGHNPQELVLNADELLNIYVYLVVMLGKAIIIADLKLMDEFLCQESANKSNLGFSKTQMMLAINYIIKSEII